MRNVSPGPPWTCLCCSEKHPAGCGSRSQGFLSTDFSFDRDYPKHCCKLLKSLLQPPYLNRTDPGHPGACECPQTAQQVTWKGQLVHHQPPKRLDPEHTIPGSYLSHLLIKTSPPHARAIQADLPSLTNRVGCPRCWIIVFPTAKPQCVCY